MIFSEEFLSESDKLDRVYRMLKAERRSRMISLFIRLFVFGGLFYGGYYLSLPAHADIRNRITGAAQARMMEVVLPMANDMVKGMTEAQSQGGTASSGGTVKRRNKAASDVNITPEMIQAVQDSMEK